jgi:hypothetical protein
MRYCRGRVEVGHESEGASAPHALPQKLPCGLPSAVTMTDIRLVWQH